VTFIQRMREECYNTVRLQQILFRIAQLIVQDLLIQRNASIVSIHFAAWDSGLPSQDR